MRLNQTLIILSIACILLSGCAMNSKAPSPQKGQHPNKMSRQVMLEMDYLLYLPENYNEQDKQWPLIVFLHGAGERGNDLDLVKLHGPPMLAEEGREFEFIIASPQCPTSHWWPKRVEHVMALIDELTETYQVDESRIYLTGLSMGGFGTWSTASAYPERFAAIAPICGGGLSYLAKNLKDVPVWVFHGDSDNVVPLSRSQEMVDALKEAGGNAKFTVYPGVGHDSWTVTYANDELYEWFLSHSKKQDK